MINFLKNNSIINLKKINFEALFISGTLAFNFFVIVSIFLAELNLFSFAFPLAIAVLLIYLALLSYLYFINKARFVISNSEIYAVAIVFVFCMLNSIFFHEPLTGGRDDGVYANEAVNLSKTNNLFIQNPIAATFPGFVQTANGQIPQFYIGYPIFIATIVKFIGLEGIKFSNFPLIFIGLISIYLLTKKLTSSSLAIATIIIISTTYPFFWFTRKPFTENFALMLTWFDLLILSKGIIENKSSYLMLSLIPATTSLVVRVESIPFFCLQFALIFFLQLRKKLFDYAGWIFLLSSILLIPAIIYYLKFDTVYTSNLLKQSRNILFNVSSQGVFSTSDITTISPSASAGNIVEKNQPMLAFVILQLYNFYLFFIYIPLGIMKGLFDSSLKKKIILTIGILSLPNLYFLISPSINFDQPWFLRRFMPIIIPWSIIMLTYFLSSFSRKIQLSVISILLVANMIVSAPIIFFVEQSGVLNQLDQQFTGKFTNSDLILVDYDSLGHYKIAEPLFFKNNVNAAASQRFTLLNLLGKEASSEPNLYVAQAFQLSQNSVCPYQNIYLLTTSVDPNPMISFLGPSDVSLEGKYSLSYKELRKTCELFRLTQHASHEEMANVDIEDAKIYCNQTPTEIDDILVQMDLYKIDPGILLNRKEEVCSN